MGLTEIAKKAAMPQGIDFVPVYGIIAGAKPDEKTFKLVKKSKDEYIKVLFANYKEVNEK